MKRSTKKNSPGVGAGTILGIGAGLAAAAGLIYAATRPSSTATSTPSNLPGYGAGNGNLSMEQRFDQGAAEYLRTHPNI